MDNLWPPLQTNTPWSPPPAIAPRTGSLLPEKAPTLPIGPSDDPLEAEAEVVADQALNRSARSAISASTRDLDRSGTSASAHDAVAPVSVNDVLSTPGDRLDAAVRRDMERRFGHDFSRVRVHTGPAAERTAREIGADAYTVGHRIVFGRNQFAPSVPSGRRLLAHELTHVVQHSADAAGAAVLRAQKTTKKKAAPKKAAPAKPKTPQICSRDSRKVKDNWITKVNIDVGTNDLTIEWDDPKKIPPLSGGTHKISPGTGRCCVDCNDEKVSQTDGSLCTPKGDTWPVDHTGCTLAGHPSAKNPTYFQRAGVAIHSGNTSSPPRSHGCARTSVEISELIHDNVTKDTQIASSGTWSSATCYLNASTDTLSNRKDVCDGNKLKTKKPGQKAKGKGAANVPMELPHETAPSKTPSARPLADATTDLDETQVAARPQDEAPEPAALASDGPGPHNAPPSHESIGEVPGEPDSVEPSDGEDLGDDTSYV